MIERKRNDGLFEWKPVQQKMSEQKFNGFLLSPHLMPSIGHISHPPSSVNIFNLFFTPSVRLADISQHCNDFRSHRLVTPFSEVIVALVGALTHAAARRCSKQAMPS